VRLDLATRARTVVLRSNWDVLGANLSKDGRRLAVSVNENARTRIQLFDSKTLAAVRMPKPKGGTLESFTLSDDALLAAFVRANGDTPGDLHVVNLKNGTERQLLRSLSPEIRQSDLVPGEVVRFKSYDGITVPGVLYVPRRAPKNGKLPAVVSIHGGPGGESRIGYKPLIQYLANHGYVVFEINNRGSSGSGKTFYHLDDRRHGDADLDDVVASKRMLADTGYVDENRIAVMGGSYGGYLTLAALAFRPDAFAAGVNMYGVSNWVRLLPNTPAWWDDLRRLLKSEMGDWEKDADYLRRISPAFHAERIKRPLFVLQGANDPRVLQVESDDIVARVRANHVPVEYVVFPDEGHSIRKKANQIVAYRAIREFLDRHVQRSAQPAAP
jgi:dipeptidyl aminopeptidase/acylaminoacyl peptidase